MFGRMTGTDWGAMIFLFCLGPLGWILIALTLYSMRQNEVAEQDYISESAPAPPSAFVSPARRRLAE